jgi:hypothetical protein
MVLPLRYHNKWFWQVLKDFDWILLLHILKLNFLLCHMHIIHSFLSCNVLHISDFFVLCFVLHTLVLQRVSVALGFFFATYASLNPNMVVICSSWGSSMTSLWAEWVRNWGLWFDSWKGKKFFLLHVIVPWPYVESTQLPVVVTRDLYLCPRHESDHSPLSTTEVNEWRCTFTVHCIFMTCRETALFYVFCLCSYERKGCEV